MCFDKELLKPYNQCKYTSLEYKHKQLFKLGDYYIKLYTDKEERQRLVIHEGRFQTISGLLLEHIGQRSGYVIKGVYTVPNERRKGYAKQLLALSRFYLGKVRHSEHLTVEGEKWMKSVENIPD